MLSTHSSGERVAASYVYSRVVTLRSVNSISSGGLIDERSKLICSWAVDSVEATFGLDVSGNASVLWSLAISMVSMLWHTAFASA